MNIKFPSYHLKTKKINETVFVFDAIRKKYIQLTPEEFVRQQVIQYLIHRLKYPSEAISIERQFKLGELIKRFDIVVYKQNQPWLIVECKSPEVPLSQNTVQQIVEYNMHLKASYLILTNGANSFGYTIKNEALVVLENLPNW